MALSRVVPATDSCVTLAIRSYTVDALFVAASTSGNRSMVYQYARRSARLTISEVDPSERVIDDRGVLLLHEIILRETPKMQYQVRGQPLTFIAPKLSSRLLVDSAE